MSNLFWICIISLIFLSLVDGASRIQPVSVFPYSASNLHKYSAILAAIEPFRLQRAEDVKQSLGYLQYWYHKAKGLVNCELVIVWFIFLILPFRNRSE